MNSNETLFVNKETESLRAICLAIKSASIEYQEIIRGGLSAYYLNLNESRKAECSEHFENFFGHLGQGLEDLSSWDELASLMKESSLYSYFDGSIFFGPSSDSLVNTCVCEYLDIFHSIISSHLLELRSAVMASNVDQLPFQDFCVLSDQDIRDLFKDRAQPPDALTQMNFLSKLKKHIKSSHGGFFLHFNFQRRRIYKLDRNFADLMKWTRDTVKELTPLVCLKNRTQKEGMRFFFSEAIANKKLEIDDLDSFIESRFYIQGSSPNSIGKGGFNITVGDEGVPSELIREIFIKVQKLKADNSKRNIQKWLFHLFFNHEGEGFSTYNIKKATESLTI